jgi:hypothetical protein
MLSAEDRFALTKANDYQPGAYYGENSIKQICEKTPDNDRLQARRPHRWSVFFDIRRANGDKFDGQ